MGRIPTGYDLGSRPATQSRPLLDIASAASGFSAGADILSRDAARSGEGSGALAKSLGEAGNAFARGEDAAEREALAAADANWTVENLKLQQSLAADADYDTVEARYRQKADEIRGKVMDGLPHGTLNRFGAKSSVDMERGALAISRQATVQRMDAGRAWTTGFLDDQRQAYLQAAGPEARNNILKGVLDGVESSRQRGFLSDVEAEKFGRNFKTEAAADSIGMMPARDQVDVLSLGMTAGSDGVPQFEPIGLNVDSIPVDRRVNMLRRAQAVVAAEDRQRFAEIGEDVRDATFVLDRGRVPAGLDNLRASVRGTKYEPILNEAIDDSGTLSTFARRPLAEQVTALRSMAATDTTDRRHLELQNRMARSYQHTTTEIDEGRGLYLGSDLGVVSGLAPFSADPAALRTRGAQAEAVSTHFGRAVAPLTPQEQRHVQDLMDKGSADEATGLLAKLYRGFGPDASSALSAQWVKSRPELGVALETVGDRPELAREILQGGKLIRQGSAKDALPTRADRDSAIHSVVGNMLTPDTASMVDPYVESANAVYALRRMATGDLGYDSAAYEKALRDTMGSPVSFNGRTILAPAPNMEASKVRDLVRAMTYDKMTEYGNGAPVFTDGKPFDPKLFERSTFGASAQLVSAAPGRYLVMVPGLGYVGTAKGGAYLLDLRSAVR